MGKILLGVFLMLLGAAIIVLPIFLLESEPSIALIALGGGLVLTGIYTVIPRTLDQLFRDLRETLRFPFINPPEEEEEEE